VSASPDQPERPAIEQWLDLVLYAPLGLAIEAQKIGPSLVKAGRDRFETRVMVAKMIGQFAVAKGRMELNKRISPPPVRPTPAAPAAAAGAVPAKSAATASKAPKPPAEASLALEGYDALAASQIVSRLGALTASQLDAIEAYETAHRGRRTVLAKIAQLRAAR
jgi:hypothetical protein